MKILLDTSVLYPAASFQHPNHQVCSALIAQLDKQSTIFVLNTHLIAELYNNLTKVPSLKIPTDTARKTIKQIATKFRPIALDVPDYLLAVDRCADLDLPGGVIYDALHFQAAIKAQVDVLYTYNLKDFTRLVTEEISFTVKAP